MTQEQRHPHREAVLLLNLSRRSSLVLTVTRFGNGSRKPAPAVTATTVGARPQTPGLKWRLIVDLWRGLPCAPYSQRSSQLQLRYRAIPTDPIRSSYIFRNLVPSARRSPFAGVRTL